MRNLRTILWMHMGALENENRERNEPSSKRLAEDIRQSLQLQIENGEIPPGAILDERDLTERFGVSRTPIREAIQQLVALNLVKIAPRQGVIVSKLSVSTIRCMLEFICELEGVIASLAAKRATPELMEQLENSLNECEKAANLEDVESYEKSNAEFHALIYKMCRNDQLVEVLLSARGRMRRYRINALFTPKRMIQSYADHLEIASAIKSGDEMAASLAAKNHVPYGNSGFSEFLSMVPEEYVSGF